MVALRLHLGGELQQHRHGREEHRCGLPRAARPDEPSDGLGEVQGGRRTGGVDANTEAGDVDALGDHADRDHPLVGRVGERADPARCRGVVGQDHGRSRAGDLGQQCRVLAGTLLVGGDHQPAGVRDPTGPDLAQSRVGCLQDSGHPVAVRVEGDPPCPGHLVGAERLTQAGGELLARVRAPSGLSGVGEEDDRTDDAVRERVGVPVGVIGLRPLMPLPVRLVGHERDRAVIGAERCSGQGQPALGVLERLADAVTPTLGVAAVVDLVEDHQRATRVGALTMFERMRRDLRIGHHDTVIFRSQRTGGVGVLGIQGDAGPGGGSRPLVLQVLGRRDHGDRVDRPVSQQLVGHAQAEGRFSCAGRGHGEEVLGPRHEVFAQCGPLPGAQRRTPGRRGGGVCGLFLGARDRSGVTHQASATHRRACTPGRPESLAWPSG